jgi:membrane-bound serine protease (ClpP class)
VLEIDSPGGYLNDSREIAETLRDLTWAHTVAYVPHEALSGAAFIALGCDEIILQPTARLGDIGVIFLDADFLFKYAPEKVRSPVATELQILAIAKNRPPALAEAMVDMDVEVFRMVNEQTGEVAFLSEKDRQGRPDAADWEVKELVPESQKGRFLTVSGARAVELRLASATVENESQLRDRFKSEREWRRYAPDNVDKTIYVLNIWWVTALLFLVGMVGMFYEFSAPGTCLGGLIAVLCFALFYWSRFQTGTAGWLEVMLFVAGILFLGAELFVIPGFGVAGVTGITLVVLSLILACQNYLIPETTEQWVGTAASAGTVLGSGFLLFILGAIAITWFGSIPGFNRLVLAPPTAPAEEAKLVQADLPVHVGQIGRAESPLVPAGRARFGDQYVDVLSESGLIDKGAAIRVLEAEPGRIVVTIAE